MCTCACFSTLLAKVYISHISSRMNGRCVRTAPKAVLVLYLHALSMNADVFYNLSSHLEDSFYRKVRYIQSIFFFSQLASFFIKKNLTFQLITHFLLLLVYSSRVSFALLWMYIYLFPEYFRGIMSHIKP